MEIKSKLPHPNDTGVGVMGDMPDIALSSVVVIINIIKIRKNWMKEIKLKEI